METVNGPRPSALHARASTLAEVLVHAHLHTALQHGVGVGVTRPRKRVPVAERLVAPRKSGVDDVLAIADHSYETAIGRVDKGGREHFGGAELLDGEGYPVSVRY